MTSGKPKKSRVVISPTQFGAFTHGNILSLLKTVPAEGADDYALLAAGFLATISSSNQGHDTSILGIATDALRQANTTFSNEVLWRVASSAGDWRVRVEATKRCGHLANSPNQREQLRTWSANGFQINHGHNNDQRAVLEQRIAAITALGHLDSPTADDVNAVIAALSPSSQDNHRDFPDGAFYAAIEAFWKIGTASSLDQVIALLKSRGWQRGGLELVGLGAKFTTAELKNHASQLWKYLRDYAHSWPQDTVVIDRLLHLARTIGTPELFVDWVSSYGVDGAEHGRGRITKAMLEVFKKQTEVTARGLLTLSANPHNTGAGGLVINKLKQACNEGFANQVAVAIISQQSQGHQHILQFGSFCGLFPSISSAVRHSCEAIPRVGHLNEQRNRAIKVATSVLMSATQGAVGENVTSFSYEVLTNRKNNPDYRNAPALIAKGVQALSQLKEDENPVVIAACFIHDPKLAPGAAALLEDWIKPNDDLSKYTIKMLVRGAAKFEGIAAAEALRRVEDFAATNLHGQVDTTANANFESALQDAVVVDNRVNQYALMTLVRRGWAWDKAVSKVMTALQSVDDVTFVFSILKKIGGSALGVLPEAIKFHRDNAEELTSSVRIQAIELAADICLEMNNDRKSDDFCRQLIDRFQDMPEVRRAAYRACGRIGSFICIKPLRDRLAKESLTSARTEIENALSLLQKELSACKPATGSKSEAIIAWLNFVSQLGEASLISQVTGYLSPPHAEQEVRQGALWALAGMQSPLALAAAKKFIENAVPEGKTLAVARQVRLLLEQRNDSGLFDALSSYYKSDEMVLDPSIDYEQILGSELRLSMTLGLKKSQALFDDNHWDEYVTKINGVAEGVVKHIYRTKYAAFGLNQQKGEQLAGGNSYAPLLSVSEFKNSFPKLQSHANTIQACRRDAPTAHAMNKNGTAKAETTAVEADYVKEEFCRFFNEAVKILR